MRITEATVRGLIARRRAALGLPLLEYSLAQTISRQPGARLGVGRYVLTLDPTGENVVIEDAHADSTGTADAGQLDLNL